jgi:hypothetical protein
MDLGYRARIPAGGAGEQIFQEEGEEEASLL